MPEKAERWVSKVDKMFLPFAVTFWFFVYLLGFHTDAYLCLWLTLVVLYLTQYVELFPWETIQRVGEVITFFPCIASFDQNKSLVVSVHGCIYHPKATTRYLDDNCNGKLIVDS